jgi:curved DNA-binding protein CbpA
MSNTHANNHGPNDAGTGAPDIPPAPDTSTFYTVLDIDDDASQATIKNAFRQQLRTHHPDQSDRDDAGEIVRALKTAREYLLNPEYRTVYDEIDHETFVEQFLGDEDWPEAGPKQTTIDAFLRESRGKATEAVNPDGVRERERRRHQAETPPDEADHEQRRWADFEWFDGDPEAVDIESSDRSWLIPVGDTRRYANPDADLDPEQMTVGGIAKQKERIRKQARAAGANSAADEGQEAIVGTEPPPELTAGPATAETGPIDRTVDYGGVTTATDQRTGSNTPSNSAKRVQPASPGHTPAQSDDIGGRLTDSKAKYAALAVGWLAATVLAMTNSGTWVAIPVLGAVCGPLYLLYDLRA